MKRQHCKRDRLELVLAAVVAAVVAALAIIPAALGQTLPTPPVAESSSGAGWAPWIAGAIVLGVLIVVAHKRWPSQAQKADAAAKEWAGKGAQAISEGIRSLLADLDRREAANAAAKPEALGPTTVVEAEPAPAVEPGRFGKAGPITINVEGTDAAADLAAFQAAYFAKPPA